MTDQFDPDALKLSKQYVIDLCDKVIKRWKGNGTDIKFILGLYTFKSGLKVVPDSTFDYVWRMLLKFINYLQMENAKAQAKSLNEKWADTLGKIHSEVDKGEFDF